MLLMNLILANLLFATGDQQLKNKNIASFSLFKIPENLPVEDLEAGLRALSTDELKTLSKFIDDQSKRQTENNYDTSNLLGVMENYWTRHVRAIKSKQKRNIEDLYDEVAHDNGEQQMKRDNSAPKDFENDGCTCRSVPDYFDENMRSKRENQYTANIEKGVSKYSIEEYVRDLENSFPRDQGEKSNGGSVAKGHLRIKRL